MNTYDFFTKYGFIKKKQNIYVNLFLKNPPVTDYAVTSPFHKGD